MLRNTVFTINKLTFAIVLSSASAMAQDEMTQDETPTKEESVKEIKADMRLEEIIVTSQKISESLQDVPISVATVGGEKLDEAGIENLEDLTILLPSIHFTETGISTQVRVRGIGSDNSQGFEQSVGMYIDGIYYGRAQLFRTPMMDLERVELLRGPQSTLFGKNSIAGALNLTTAKPTEHLEGFVSLSHEPNYDTNEVNAVVSGPINDTLRARLAIRGAEDKGYYTNTFKDLKEPNSEEQAARITLDWSATDSLQFILKGERNEFESLGRSIEITQDVALDLGEGDTTTANFGDFLTLLNQPPLDPDLNFERQADQNELSDNTITNITLTTNYDYKDYELTLVSGLLKYDYKENCDCDFTAAELLDLRLDEDYEQFSQEIRLTSPRGETVEWLAGLYYQDYDQTFADDLYVFDSNLLPRLEGLGPISNTAVGRDFTQTSESWAVFGRATWNISDQLHLTLGARYTEEDKTAEKALTVYDPLTGEIITDPLIGFVYLSAFKSETNAATIDFRPDTFGQPLANAGHDVSGERSESAFTPFVNLEYNVNGDIMTYATFTTGFKAGGFDPRSNSVGKFALDTSTTEYSANHNFEFEEEKAVAGEIGLKSTLADGRGEVNLAIYRTDYEDLQISQFDGGVGFNVGNAKETRVQGIEIDGRWLLVDGLTARYGLSLLDFKYIDFKNGNCHTGSARDTSVGTADLDGDLVVVDGEVVEGKYELCDYTGKRGVYTPEYTVNFGLDYFRTISGSLSFAGFIDMQHVDGHAVHVNLDPSGDIDSYTVLTMRLGLETDRWAIGLLGKNLLDEEIVSYSGNAPLSDSQFDTNTHYSFVRRPLTVALEGKIKF